MNGVNTPKVLFDYEFLLIIMSDQNSLESALDGLVEAIKYAEDIGEYELAKDISSLYQELGRRSPDDHWDNVYKCIVTGVNIQEVVEDVDEAVNFGESEGDKVELHATSDAISELEDHDDIVSVDIVDE